MDQQLTTIYKILNKLSKSNPYFEKFKNDEIGELDLNDSISYVLTLLLNTGYVFHERLDNIDWQLSETDVSSDFSVNNRFYPNEVSDDDFSFGDIDKVIEDSYKYHDSENIEDDENLSYVNKYFSEYDDFIEDFDINKVLQIIRNASAHSHLFIYPNSSIVETYVKDQSITYGYQDLYNFMDIFMNYLIYNSDFNKISEYPEFIDKRENYEMTKRSYRKHFDHTFLSEQLEEIIRKINKMDFNSPELYECVLIFKNYNLLSLDDLDDLITGKNTVDLDNFKNNLLEILVRQMTEKFYGNNPDKTVPEEKLEEYRIIFDEIYKIYSLGKSIPRDVSLIEACIEEINDDFNYLIENKTQCFNIREDKSKTANILVLLTIILGMMPWNNIDIDSLNLSSIKIDDDFNKVKNSKYNDELLNISAKYYEIEENMKKLSNNKNIPKDKLEKLLEKQQEKKDSIINSIYSKKSIKDEFVSNSNVIRHLRNSFAHGYHLMDGEDLIIEDYDSDSNLTFKAKVNIYKLLDIVLSQEVLNNLNENKKIR